VRGENIEMLWYGFCLIEAVVTVFVLYVAVLLGQRFLRCIPWNRVKRRSAKHPMVHSLGTVRPPRKSDVSKSKAADLDPGDLKRRIG
jgi:hypothetical protein